MIQNTQEFKNRARDAQHKVAGAASCASSRMCGYIENNPKSSLLIGLGVGFGAGLVLASLVGSSTDYFSRSESFAERIGNKVADSVRGAVPHSWKNHFRS